jgi:rhodanese-related sulfurtransferase
MKLTNFKFPALALVVSAVLGQATVYAQGSAAPEAAKEPAFKAHVLKRAELDALLAHPEKVLLIDVRRPDELTSIGGFPVYLNVQLADLEKELAWIPKGRDIVTVSNHAGRAGKAADLLSSKGFKVAGAVGAQTYETEGGTLTKVAAKAPATPQAKPASGAAQ